MAVPGCNQFWGTAFSQCGMFVPIRSLLLLVMSSVSHRVQAVVHRPVEPLNHTIPAGGSQRWHQGEHCSPKCKIIPPKKLLIYCNLVFLWMSFRSMARRLCGRTQWNGWEGPFPGPMPNKTSHGFFTYLRLVSVRWVRRRSLPKIHPHPALWSQTHWWEWRDEYEGGNALRAERISVCEVIVSDSARPVWKPNVKTSTINF